MEEKQNEGQKKFIYLDDGRNKVLKGDILFEDEFLITIKAINTGAVIRLGKNTIVSIQPVRGCF